jgi:hypothetical protein
MTTERNTETTGHVFPTARFEPQYVSVDGVRMRADAHMERSRDMHVARAVAWTAYCARVQSRVVPINDDAPPLYHALDLETKKHVTF